MNDIDSSPAVVAYRVAQLELTVRDGFERQTEQLTKIVDGFVTEKEMIEARKEGDEEHKRLWAAIADIKKSAKWWVGVLLSAILASVAVIGLVIK